MLFKRLNFQNKLLVTFMFVFIPLILIGSTIAYVQIKKILQISIEKELQDTTDSLLNLIKTSATVSIKNRLYAIAEKNLDIAEYYYSKYRSGLLSRSEAIKTIEEIFLSQDIGISGYIYCLNSKGIVTIHPNDKVRNSDVSEFDFVKKQMEIKDGYLEYDWKNPGEASERPKALYMVYFKPLDWIISVSSYRGEFNYLVNIDDFKESILAYKTGKTGYAYILDEKGTAVVHPKLQGINLLNQSKYPNDFLKQIIKEKNGKINYLWKNPGEIEPREKIVIFKHLPEYKWIVASSSYVEEVFGPLDIFRNLLVTTLVVVVFLSIGITYLISKSVTKPLTLLMCKLEEGAKGDFSVRMDEKGRDEFSQLSRHFNSFMGQLEKNQEKIESEIKKNIEARTALEKNDLKLRGLFNQSFQYTGILSLAGTIEEINQSGLDFAGCTNKDIVSKPFWEAPWFSHDTDARQHVKEGVEDAIQGTLVRFETTSISKDGEIKNIDISLKPVFDTLGEVAFVITESRDITEYKLAALERKNMAVQLEKAQKMEAIGTLAGGIAHDFNNILSGVFGYAQLAELNLKTPVKAKEHISQIVKGAQRAAELVQQILTFSRKSEYEKHPLFLHIVVKEALKLLRSSIPSTIEIRESFSSTAKIIADPTQMHQVVMNLCTNAYHAMGETGGFLTVKLREVGISSEKDFFGQMIKKGKYLELEISDTGLGMDDETLLKAFDPYFTTKEVGKGTGFGLSVVHAIIDAHDGFIKAESSKGQGTSFYICLPVVDQEVNPEKSKMEKKILKGGTEKIMVVDDEEDIRLIVQEFLTKLGYLVTTFADGAKAFEAFQKDPDQYDLIITDMTMPHMSGDELSQKVLKIRQSTPIIMCSGYSERISEAKALEMGILKYAQKPLPNEKLAALIRAILDKSN
ncbi:MAG: cache domain-containing protein [Desulfobacteraceae bacterium]|nr:cache domain-containing protein [Desulfobacteraceae bacterium]